MLVTQEPYGEELGSLLTVSTNFLAMGMTHLKAGSSDPVKTLVDLSLPISGCHLLSAFKPSQNCLLLWSQITDPLKPLDVRNEYLLL
jgi:hypothetical protein